MLIEVFKSKIHRVRVTASDLNYIGSITIDEDLLDASGIVVGERVYIVNVNNATNASGCKKILKSIDKF